MTGTETLILAGIVSTFVFFMIVVATADAMWRRSRR